MVTCHARFQRAPTAGHTAVACTAQTALHCFGEGSLAHGAAVNFYAERLYRMPSRSCVISFIGIDTLVVSEHDVSRAPVESRTSLLPTAPAAATRIQQEELPLVISACLTDLGNQ